MTRAGGLNSINCTQCGAGLSVLGGGRVLTHVCGYCGAVLDTQDNYKVLASIGKRNHPASPVQIGMTLTVEGVDFTVIGTIGKLEVWGGRHYGWVEHQLFSPTHGYAWLTYETGNFTFSRKVRDFDMAQWLDTVEVEAAEHPPRRVYRGETYRYYETSTAKIDFMEGEFNWVPELGEATTSITLLGPDAMLDLREGKTEKDVELTRLLPRAQVIEEMGLDRDAAAAAPFHPLTPYAPLPEERFMRRAFVLSAVAALVMALVFGLMGGSRVLDRQSVQLGAGPVSFPFEITNTSQLARLRYETTVSNAWVVLATRITGPDGALVVEGERLVEYYSGRDSDGAWSEGNRNANLNFRPVQAGPHQISISRNDGSGTGISIIDISITQGKPAAFWMYMVAVLFLLGWIALVARRAAHTKRRFLGGDWHEE